MSEESIVEERQEPEAEASSSESNPTEAAPAAKLPRRKIVGRTLGALALLLALALAALSQTREGQELVLNATLDRIRGSLAGELFVGGIRSGTLLTGATLTELRLTAADGQNFLTADSVVVRYSIPAAVAGGQPIRSTTFYGADVEISQYSADDVLNVTRLLAEDDQVTEPTGPGEPVSLGRIGVRESRVRLLTPAASDSRRTVPGPDGPLRQIAWEELDLDLEDVLLRPGASVAFEARLASLTSEIYLVDEPLRLVELFGEVTFGALGIQIEDAAFRLPSSLLRGDLVMGPERPDDPWTLRVSLEADGWGDLADMQWIDERIPDGRFRGGADVSVPSAIEVDFDQFQIELEASEAVADGWIRFSGDVPLRNMEVTASPLSVDRLEPWLGVDIPFDGFLSGQATFSGSLVDLGMTGRMTVLASGFGGTPTIADFSGTVHRGQDPGATDFSMRLDPLNYETLRSIWPGFELGETGSATISVNGRAAGALNVITDFEHESTTAGTSLMSAYGMLRRADDGEWLADLRGELRPLELAIFDVYAPDLGLGGDLAGPVRAEGRLDALRVTGDLVTEGGGVVVDARVNLRAPSVAYAMDVEADGLPVSSLTERFPEPSTWTGSLGLSGSGFTLDSITGLATLTATGSRIGPVHVDQTTAALRLLDGVLVADTLRGVVGGIDLEGRGRFGLVPGSWGSSRLTFTAPTLVGLRPLVMGVPDSVIARDNLTDLDLGFLIATGVDPDTLPLARDVRMTGAVNGQASLSGEIGSFELSVIMDVEDGAYRDNQVGSARIAYTATDLPRLDGVWGLGMTARDIVWQGRSFEQGGFDAEMVERVGIGRAELVRSADERYAMGGGFAFDSTSGRVDVDSATIESGPDLWALQRPTTVAWSPNRIEIDSLLIVREGDDPMSLEAAGVLARGGSSDFSTRIRGLHVENVVDIAQIDGLDIGGRIDLTADVSGPAEAPLIEGDFAIEDGSFGAMQIALLRGSAGYADRALRVDISGSDGQRDALRGAGVLPLDLAFVDVEQRVLDEPAEIRLSADSLDAAIALGYLTSLTNVIGAVTGTVDIGGTLREPEPQGLIVLEDAAWSIEEIGVRHTGIDGSLTLNPDRTVDVIMTAEGPGAATVTGEVLLNPISNPELGLTFAFERFQAVDRLDIEGVLSGEVDLSGNYRRPVATGALSVDESTVYVDEFQRIAGVVDLRDQQLFQEVLGVDTTALVSQPLLAGLRNPFFDNLRMDVDLAVPAGGTLLRSIDTNVELAGDLFATYDRQVGDLVLVGTLEAVRGSHLVLGRNFGIEGGQVSFTGRPGMNPDLDIQASTRIFRIQDESLEVDAQVGGTLIQPIVSLSTEEVGSSEADIVSYLLFGHSSGELEIGQNAFLGSAARSTDLSAGVDGTLTYLRGALANQFGAALAQTGFLDYASVQVGGGTAGDRVDRFLGTRAQFELGWYLGRDVFAVLVLQHGSASASEQAPIIGGARLDWALSEAYRIEGFWEDRYLRSSSTGFVLPGLDNHRIMGVFLFRDWGY